MSHHYDPLADRHCRSTGRYATHRLGAVYWGWTARAADSIRHRSTGRRSASRSTLPLHVPQRCGVVHPPKPKHSRPNGYAGINRDFQGPPC